MENEAKIVELSTQFFEELKKVTNGNVQSITIKLNDDVSHKAKASRGKEKAAGFGCIFIPGVGVVCF